MSGLTIIKPITVTQAMLVSTDVTEADYATYAGGTTYALDARVIYNSVIYQSLANSNTGNQPDITPLKWVVVSATNRWKLFDLVNSSQTAKSTSMTYSIRPGTPVTGLAAVNLTSVTSIRVRMVSDEYGTVFDQTIDRTRVPPGSSWWAWMFGRRTESISSYFNNLPSFLDAVITVDFTGLTDMAVGTLLLGTTSTWGIGVQLGMSLGIRDYSRKETNQWGDVVLDQRSFADTSRFNLVVNRSDVPALRTLLRSLRATPCLWINNDDTLYGYYQDFEILINYASVSECELQLESLT